MKKPYQIESQRAVGELIRPAGLRVMDLLMREEVREPVGERSQRQAERTDHRFGAVNATNYSIGASR
jgi:hypothetical protein